MTNTDKAIEIANLKDIYTKSVSQGDIINAALEMAEWKDAQFKEYLEKKLKEKMNRYSGGTQFFGFGQIACIEEIINELLGGE